MQPGLTLAAVAVVLVLVISRQSVAQDPKIYEEHVYLIKATSPTGAVRILTGFKAKGLNGIVTCLHGVVDADGGISAANYATQTVYNNLSLSEIDYARDLAILDRETPIGNTTGLAVDGLAPTGGDAELKIVGFPLGIMGRELGHSVKLRNPPLRTIGSVTPPPIHSELRKRGSPDPTIPALSLENNLLPGHSGAPVIDSRGQVLGVANGGLDRGRAGIGWAIVLSDAKWVSSKTEDSKRHIAELAKSADLSTSHAITSLTQEGASESLNRIWLKGPYDTPSFQGVGPLNAQGLASLYLNRYLDPERTPHYIPPEKLAQTLSLGECSEYIIDTHSIRFLLPKSYQLRSTYNPKSGLILEGSPRAPGGESSRSFRIHILLLQDVYVKRMKAAFSQTKFNSKPGELPDAAAKRYMDSVSAKRVEMGVVAIRSEFEKHHLFLPARDELFPFNSLQGNWDGFKVYRESKLIMGSKLGVRGPDNTISHKRDCLQRVYYINREQRKLRLVHYLSSIGDALLVNEFPLSDYEKLGADISDEFLKHMLLDLSFSFF